MPKEFTTINVSMDLKAGLRELAGKVAKKDGSSKVSLAQLIERMKKRYEDTEEL